MLTSTELAVKKKKNHISIHIFVLGFKSRILTFKIAFTHAQIGIISKSSKSP